MSALYMHIPFCRSRCIYCDFHSGTDTTLQQRYVAALCRESELRARELGGEPVDTLYLGGGTPSQLGTDALHALLHGVSQHIAIDHCRELTIECNPDDLTHIYIGALRSLPFNRISMGVQSFHNDDLAFLRRRHTAQGAIDAVHRCQDAGYDNISIDLIYGLPGQTLAAWEHNVATAVSLGVQHISAYALTYEEGAALHHLLQQGKVCECDDETMIAMYDLLIDRLAYAGYEQYEISNFALPGRRSQHNSAYWQDVPYLGLGAAAHSYDGATRRYNPCDTRRYIESIEAGRCCYDEERLTADDRYNDMLLTRLRTRRGIDCTKVAARFGDARAAYLARTAAPYVAQGAMEYVGDHLRIARRAIFISDSIISDLFHLEGDE